MKTIGIIFCFGFSLLLQLSLAEEHSLPPSDAGIILVKNIPEFPAIEVEIHGSGENAWRKSFRQGIRYLALAQSGYEPPLIITHPDWDLDPWKPQEKRRLLLLLSRFDSLPEPKEIGLRIVPSRPVTVVSYAYRGAYTEENFISALKKVYDHLNKIGIPASAPPRWLLYSNIDWTPDFLKLAEVQVPIPANQ